MNLSDELLAALERLPTPLPCFVRDDDAGWDDLRLLRLLDVMADAEVPIDLAAIPMAVTDGLARQLVWRHDAAPQRVRIHQHGHTHENHESTDRRCEFGDARDAHALHTDLRRGRERLLQCLGHRVDAIFTPPWNRCSTRLPSLLAELGYAALSRDRSAPAQHALPELRVDVDWSRHQREGGSEAVTRALDTALLARARDGQPFGLMLHHAAMQEGELRLLGQWLRAIAGHPRLRWRPMATLLARPSPRPDWAPEAGLAPKAEPRAAPSAALDAASDAASDAAPNVALNVAPCVGATAGTGCAEGGADRPPATAWAPHATAR